MTNEIIEQIPHDQTSGFPTGVSEVAYDTEEEMNAFMHGLTYADDIDQYNGTPFQRAGKWVVRVCVGNWDNLGDGE